MAGAISIMPCVPCNPAYQAIFSKSRVRRDCTPGSDAQSPKLHRVSDPDYQPTRPDDTHVSRLEATRDHLVQLSLPECGFVAKAAPNAVAGTCTSNRLSESKMLGARDAHAREARIIQSSSDSAKSTRASARNASLVMRLRLEEDQRKEIRACITII